MDIITLQRLVITIYGYSNIAEIGDNTTEIGDNTTETGDNDTKIRETGDDDTWI